MKTATFGYANGNCQASHGRQYSHAFTSRILVADVGRVASAFDVFIDIISKIIKRILYKQDMNMLQSHGFRII